MADIKKSLIFLTTIIALFLMSGCSASYKQDFMQGPNKMSLQKSVLIVTPKNGSYKDIPYETSGADVVQALAQELKHYSTSINIVPNQSIEDIGSEIENYDYIIIPEILHWEDRLTGWSLRPDRIQVRFDIFDKQRQMINSVKVTGKSANIVWVSKTPKSLLPKPLRLVFTKLFQ